MDKIELIKATQKDLAALLEIRFEMLKEVNNLDPDYIYDDDFVRATQKYFEEGNQTTVLAYDGAKVIGCASMSYIHVMPTFSHPTGKRAHLMNVYTQKDYRRRGISKEMIQLLIQDAKAYGATEISLDATDMGRPLYEALHFSSSASCMFMDI